MKRGFCARHSDNGRVPRISVLLLMMLVMTKHSTFGTRKGSRDFSDYGLQQIMVGVNGIGRVKK